MADYAPEVQMEARLQRQIDEIANTAPGNACRIIVQMKPPEELTKFIEETANAGAERRQAFTARVLLPPPARQFRDAGGDTKAKPAKVKSLKSRFPYFDLLVKANSSLPSVERASLFRQGEEALDSLVKSELGKDAVQFRVASSAALVCLKK